jgi:hypothetical protein
MNAFQNRFQTPAEGDVLFGTNGIRRKKNYLNDQPNLGLSAVAPDGAIANPEDAAMQPLMEKGDAEAIMPEQQNDMNAARGEAEGDDMAAIQSIINNPALPDVLEKLKLAKQSNPAFGPAFRAAYQAQLDRSVNDPGS